MKKYLLFILLCLSAKANDSNLVINVLLPHYDFLPPTAVYSDTSNNTVFTNFTGYIYPSNFTGITRWQFPPQIITSTNYYIGLNILTTNINSYVTGAYRLFIYTNNATTPYYDSADIPIVGSLPVNTNNVQLISLRANLNSNFSKSMCSNITTCAIYYKLGPYTNNWYTEWLIGGFIAFQ